MTALFIIERWCDCNPACGQSGTHEYYLNTWRSLRLGKALVCHYDQLPVHETCRQAIELADLHKPDLVIYTEVGGHPNAQVHSLWPLFASRGIPVVAIWHDTANLPAPDKDGVRLNVMVDLTRPNGSTRNAIGLWTPHDTSLFFDGNQDRDLDVLYASSRSHKQLAREYVTFLEQNGVPVYWAGGQREDRLGWYEYASMYRRSKIVINFARNTPGGFMQLKGRVTEAIYSGCLLLEHSNPYSEELLRPNIDCVYFDTPSELLDKIRYYLSHSEERVRIAQSGHRRALDDYSPGRWWGKVLSAVGLDKQLKPS